MICQEQQAISIHALLAESDNSLFTSVVSSADFYPRSPCGERHDWPPVRDIIQWISIHALLAESDVNTADQEARKRLFLSTLSLRRATCYSLRHSTQGWHFYPRSPCGERPRARVLQRKAGPISIHALLAESDEDTNDSGNANLHFYPRSPCGERRKPKTLKSRRIVFLSTLSLRRATDNTARRIAAE